jgi:hypothetical protein
VWRLSPSCYTACEEFEKRVFQERRALPCH